MVLLSSRAICPAQARANTSRSQAAFTSTLISNRRINQMLGSVSANHAEHIVDRVCARLCVTASSSRALRRSGAGCADEMRYCACTRRICSRLCSVVSGFIRVFLAYGCQPGVLQFDGVRWLWHGSPLAQQLFQHLHGTADAQ